LQILFVTPFYAPEWKFGGPPRKISGLAESLGKNQRFEIRVVTLHSSEPKDDRVRIIKGICVQYLPWVGNGLRQIPRRWRLLESEIARADVVQCFGLYNLVVPLAAWFARRAHRPFVVEPMGMFVPRNRSLLMKRLYHALITRWLFRNAAGVIATSQLEARELETHVDPGQIFIRPNGVTLEDVAAINRIEARREWGVDKDEQLIGYLGRISRKKQLTNLVAAFGSASASKTKLLIAGPVTEADYQRELLKVIDKSPRKQNIIVRGLLEGEHYIAALKALDLFVLPSENENFGNAAAEAVLAGIPVLLTHDCGVAPVIDGRVGLAVDQGIEALAAGMRTMLQP
jgi:glycosyltransferase involved in cell wall biosynthesis